MKTTNVPSREFLWILTPALKSPSHGVLDIGQFHSPQMKPCKSPDYFVKVSFHIVVDMTQGESNIFQISTWKAFLLLKICKNIFIMKNLTDFGNTVETGVDPCLPNSRA